MKKALFEGLVFTEDDQPVMTTYIGDEPCYVINDDGFLRHISSEEIDKQVLNYFKKQMEGKEDLISEQTGKMLGQEDIFSRALIENQLKNLDKQFEMMLVQGIPQEIRSYLGMMGLKVIVNFHGEVVRITEPSRPSGEGDE